MYTQRHNYTGLVFYFSSSGLFLQSSESLNCGLGFESKNKICVDEDECETPNRCGDHAQCLNTHGSYNCTCKEGFLPSTPNITAITGQCSGTVNLLSSELMHYICLCKTYVNECVSSVCGAHSSCFNTLGSFRCICSPGFQRHENSTCTDINECSDPDVCGTNANCSNHQGSYSCKCHQGYSNYGNNQSKCIEMSCDHFDSDAEDAPLKNLLALLRSNCESLRGPNGGRQTGEQLLENVFTSFDELLSEGNIADGKMLNQFLDVVENSMRLIGPQLKEPVTRMETHNTFAELAVMRGKTPPSGRVTLSTDSALFSTSWETVVGKSYPGFAFAALVSYKDLNSSRDLLHKMSRERSDDEERRVTYQLNSKVVTAVVSNAETKQLSEPVTLVFTHEEERAESEGMAYSCFIADLVFLCGISSTQNKVCVLYLLYMGPTSVFVHKRYSCSSCGIVAGLLHFFFLSAFCWMLLEGVQLYRMVVMVFHTTLKHLYMYLVGYGVPLIIVAISAIAFSKGYGTDRHCWLSLDRYFIWSFFAPVCIIVVLNSFVFVITVWKLAEKFSSINPDLSKLRNIRGFTVTAVAQMCVLGGMWVFGCFLFQEKGTQVALYLFTILNSLQGALIFIMHCLLSKPVFKTHTPMQKKKMENTLLIQAKLQRPCQTGRLLTPS
uniref:Uncharacterized protein n=1 Tax=Cyprinus carpio TaxID=7962 RepID=A0A8C2D959_CYPCA